MKQRPSQFLSGLALILVVSFVFSIRSYAAPLMTQNAVDKLISEAATRLILSGSTVKGGIGPGATAGWPDCTSLMGKLVAEQIVRSSYGLTVYRRGAQLGSGEVLKLTDGSQRVERFLSLFRDLQVDGKRILDFQTYHPIMGYLKVLESILSTTKIGFEVGGYKQALLNYLLCLEVMVKTQHHLLKEYHSMVMKSGGQKFDERFALFNAVDLFLLFFKSLAEAGMKSTPKEELKTPGEIRSLDLGDFKIDILSGLLYFVLNKPKKLGLQDEDKGFVTLVRDTLKQTFDLLDYDLWIAWNFAVDPIVGRVSSLDHPWAEATIARMDRAANALLLLKYSSSAIDDRQANEIMKKSYLRYLEDRFAGSDL